MRADPHQSWYNIEFEHHDATARGMGRGCLLDSSPRVYERIVPKKRVLKVFCSLGYGICHRDELLFVTRPIVVGDLRSQEPVKRRAILDSTPHASGAAGG